MTVGEMAQRLGLEVAAGSPAGEGVLERPVTGGYCSDLLSDVMANAKEGVAWITIQTHKNVVAVALLTGVACVIMAGGRKPDEDSIAKANEEKVALLCSSETSFSVAGRLYSLLKG